MFGSSCYSGYLFKISLKIHTQTNIYLPSKIIIFPKSTFFLLGFLSQEKESTLFVTSWFATFFIFNRSLSHVLVYL